MKKSLLILFLLVFVGVFLAGSVQGAWWNPWTWGEEPQLSGDDDSDSEFPDTDPCFDDDDCEESEECFYFHPGKVLKLGSEGLNDYNVVSQDVNLGKGTYILKGNIKANLEKGSCLMDVYSDNYLDYYDDGSPGWTERVEGAQNGVEGILINWREYGTEIRIPEGKGGEYQVRLRLDGRREDDFSGNDKPEGECYFDDISLKRKDGYNELLEYGDFDQSPNVQEPTLGYHWVQWNPGEGDTGEDGTTPEIVYDGGSFSDCVERACGDGYIDVGFAGESCDFGSNGDPIFMEGMDSCEDIGDWDGGELGCYSPGSESECRVDTSGCYESDEGEGRIFNVRALDSGDNLLEEIEQGESIPKVEWDSENVDNVDIRVCEYESHDCSDAIEYSGDEEVSNIEVGEEIEGRAFVGILNSDNEGVFNTSQTFRVLGSGAGECNNNGILDEGEACDRDRLDGKDCESFGFSGGTLTCDDTCEFDTSGCTDYDCNNDGHLDVGKEACDGDELGGKTCSDFDDFTGGTLTCDDTCEFDTSGCSSSPRPSTISVDYIEIEPKSRSVDLGSIPDWEYTVNGYESLLGPLDGIRTHNVVDDSDIYSLNQSIATINGDNKVVPVSVGETVVCANYTDDSGVLHRNCTDLTITPKGTDELSSIELKPDEAEIGVGDFQTYNVTAYYSGSSSQVVTDYAIINSSNSSIASINGDEATGVSNGTVDIVAYYNDGDEAESDSVRLKVGEGGPDCNQYDLGLVPPEMSVNVSLSESTDNFTVLDFESGEDVTDNSDIYSLNQSIATINGDNKVVPEDVGETVVLATYQGCFASGAHLIIVDDDELVDSHIKLEPQNSEIDEGGIQDYTAKLIDSNGEEEDVIDEASFSSSDPDVANNSEGDNEFEGLVEGVVIIDAFYEGLESSAILEVVGGISPQSLGCSDFGRDQVCNDNAHPNSSDLDDEELLSNIETYGSGDNPISCYTFEEESNPVGDEWQANSSYADEDKWIVREVPDEGKNGTHIKCGRIYSCGCDWSEGNCNNKREWVETITGCTDDDYGYCETDVGDLVGECVEPGDEYTVSWTAEWYDENGNSDGESSENNCESGDVKFPCPPMTVEPFFSLVNFVIAGFLTLIFYFFFVKTFRKNEQF